MRVAFILNGVVIGIGAAHDGGLIFSPNDAGVAVVDLTDDIAAAIGDLYNASNKTFSTAPTPDPAPDPVEWLIDVGPFMDRFGVAKMAVLTSADVTVKAIMTDMFARKWIDLKRADVPAALSIIGAVVPGVTAELISHILTAPVSAEENLALRKSFFNN